MLLKLVNIVKRTETADLKMLRLKFLAGLKLTSWYEVLFVHLKAKKRCV